MPIYGEHTNAKCHEVTLSVKLLANIATQHYGDSKIFDIITHVILNTINGAISF